MKQKFTPIVAAVLMLVCLGGCDKQKTQNHDNNGSSYSTVNHASEPLEQHDNDSQIDGQGNTPSYKQKQDSNPVDGEQLLAGCTLTGTVTDFSTTGCKLSPSFQDGELAYEAAKGYEDESDFINVIYQERCSFQVANVNIITGSVAYDDATVETVKKQARVVIYGDYDSENNLIADHVYIYRAVED